MRNIGTAFIYCDWGRRSEQTAFNIIKSITRQLVERRLTSTDWPQSREEVEIFFKKHNAAPPLLEDYISFLPSVISKFERVFIVVDAIDELDGVSQREQFVGALLGLSNIRLFVTSRDHILPVEGSATLEIQSDPEDIKTYVESRIQRSVPLRNAIHRKPSLKDDILDKVSKEYSNMYVF